MNRVTNLTRAMRGMWEGQFSERVLKHGVIAAIVLLIAFFSFRAEYFLSVENFLDIMRAVSILVIVATGVTFSVVVDGFDVSVGATTGLSVILTPALMVIWNLHWLGAIAVSLCAGGLIGLINSFLVVKVRIPDLLATLGVMYVVQGIQLNITQGDSVYRGMTNPWSPTRELTSGEIAPEFLQIGQGFVFSTENFRGIPIPVILMFGIVLIAWVFLERTRFGRAMYATGGNREAARLAGINVNGYRTAAYVISAVLATIGGLVLSSRIGSGAVKAGDPYLLDGVAATFFGFAVLAARRPNVFGTLLGALFVGIMLNGLTMMNVPWYIQDVVKGLILIVALGVSFSAKK